MQQFGEVGWGWELLGEADRGAAGVAFGVPAGERAGGGDGDAYDLAERLAAVALLYGDSMPT
ncbi:hypothetical protein PWY87_08715 [Kribbella solani]|nr:hypothetical protein [Kribbella solani]MDX3001745.1 hypothetical protein [Kribbella solani]